MAYRSITPIGDPTPRSLIRQTGVSAAPGLHIQIDGVDATLTQATLRLVYGTTIIATYTSGSGLTISGGQVSAVIPSSAWIDQINLWESLCLSWSGLANGSPWYWQEYPLVTDQEVDGACTVEEVEGYDRAIADPDNYITGHRATDASPGWVYLGERTWKDLRFDLWEEFPQFDLQRIRSPESLRRVHRERWLAAIYKVLGSDRGMGSYYLDQAKEHAGVGAHYYNRLRLLIRDASSLQHPDQPTVTNRDAERPATIHEPNDSGWI